MTVPDIRRDRDLRSGGGRQRAARLVLCVAVALGVAAGVAAEGAGDPCAVVGIDRIGPLRLAEVSSLPDLSMRLELDGELFVCGPPEVLARVAAGFSVLRRWGAVAPNELRVAQGYDPASLRAAGVDVLASGGGFTVVRGEAYVLESLEAAAARERPVRRRILSAPDAAVLARQAANDRLAMVKSVDETVLALVEAIDAERWFGDLVTLTTYERWDYGGGLLDAQSWLVQQLGALPGVVAETQAYTIGDTPAYNVVATLAGTTDPDEWYVVGGHVDAVNGSPGAEDNASGCAGVLEMARVFSEVRPPATMLFICYSGEEISFNGSEDHVSRLLGAGDDAKVAAMLNMDMIGYTADAELDCLLQSWYQYQSLVDAFVLAAQSYTSLSIVTTTYTLLSDHLSYLNAGMPALLTIEKDYNVYPDYHRSTDVPANITLEMGHEILKMNVAALARLMEADIVLFADGFESGATDRWTPSP